MPSAVICKLNQTYLTALADKRFKYVVNYTYKCDSIWGENLVTQNVIRDMKKKDNVITCNSALGTLRCCGLNELDCQELSGAWEKYADDVDFPKLVAQYIKHGIPVNDQRVVIIGIPIKVGASSQYNIAFYERLREVLEDFGFKQVGMKYKNKNSKNTIIAMVGQLP